ncbi:MAG TPA: hypothetical protein VKG87_10075, partial [Terriglobales bacterium]|nr:hypothetical protein [Terriglobales bacterium]
GNTRCELILVLRVGSCRLFLGSMIEHLAGCYRARGHVTSAAKCRHLSLGSECEQLGIARW